MNRGQYKKLMWHLIYIESLLENSVNAINNRGGYCECPICKAKFPAFTPRYENLRPNAKCPNCRSLERHRVLWLLIQKLEWHRTGISILHFAPEGVFYKLFSSFKDINYWPVDLDPKLYNGMVKKAVDITKIPFAENSFDLIMATHVLEHIPDDKKAISECFRVLKPNGIALLNVPVYNIPATFENPEYNTPELRLKYFGQEDHVRKYGLDYPQRLRDAGFTVHLFENIIDEKDFRRYGINKNEKFYWCTKDESDKKDVNSQLDVDLTPFEFLFTEKSYSARN